MIDCYRADRQFERFLLGSGAGYDPNEPPDDRKTYEDMLRYPGQAPAQPSEDDIVIATITYNRDAKTVTIERKI